MSFSHPHTPAAGTPAAVPSPDGTAGGFTLSRFLLAVAVVFVLLVTTGWTARQMQNGTPGARTAALTAWEQGTIAGRDLPDVDAAPTRVAAFFDALTPGQRRRLADRHALVVGNLNGVPVGLRYRANRVALTEAAERERRRHADERLSPTGRHTAGRRMHRFDSMLEEGRQILAFDPTGLGRAAEVFGDLERAERISVVVPGADVDLLTFERTRMKYAAPAGMAEALHEEQRAAAPAMRTATIAWADYTAPRGTSVDTATGELARAGAGRLLALLSALPGEGGVALLCHSYGSVVCGLAVPDAPGRITDVAVAGSPGVRAGSARDLGREVRVWAMRTSDDWIGDVPHLSLGGLGHGPDPMSESFGARRLTTDGAEGHTGYFVPGTGSLENLAAVGTGAYHSAELR
ncbi:alpha/beta hydrolase [Streptomyces sp. WMMC1477]|uniref:alpha/beta hydrolase n=1 Tax=Streptomyces sp. WMMC1477 TaxID=3015155 RepID=UPI0022B6A2A3|nr:alpha/beta hydrolase [Streptomyces sp. WMMC1477]MCZ7431062.1 alpha/beta hydrolase [Streptomyces sp. WMMC1477]